MRHLLLIFCSLASGFAEEHILSVGIKGGIPLSDAFANVQNQSCILVELSLRLGRLASYLDIKPTVTAADLLAGDNALEVNAVNQALVRVTDRYQVLLSPELAGAGKGRE